jgi:hypothetical protein
MAWHRKTAVGFVPPILLLPVAAGVIWIIAGFRRDRQAAKP